MVAADTDPTDRRIIKPNNISKPFLDIQTPPFWIESASSSLLQAIAHSEACTGSIMARSANTNNTFFISSPCVVVLNKNTLKKYLNFTISIISILLQ